MNIIPIEEVRSILKIHFLFAFDYKLPKPPEQVNRVLYLHTCPQEKSEASIARLMELCPEAEFHILASSSATLSLPDTDRVKITRFPQQFISENFNTTEEGKRLMELDFDLMFFGMNTNFNEATVSLWTDYENVFKYVKNIGLIDVAQVIDGTYQVRAFKTYDRWTYAANINGITYYVPWTLLEDDEAFELCRLAAEGPGEGAVVNLGHFQGGSSVLLAKSLICRNGDKLYSFDPVRFSWTDELFKGNQITDRVVFTQARSEIAVKDWGKRADTRIRLLFIDADHTYEGCKRDILDWSPYVVPGGTICVHDYCNTGPCWASLTPIVKAVHDTILVSNQFQDYRRVGSIFIATKKV